MKYAILKVTLCYSENNSNKDVFYPNVETNNIEEYRKNLKKLVFCDRILIDYKEVEP